MSMSVDAGSKTEPIIVMTRIFDAPRAKVWEAFTKPEHVSIWYGGKDFSTSYCKMDVRPGGHWLHGMRVPSGAEYPLDFVYVEVVKPEKLVWEHADHGTRKEGPPTCRYTVTLEDMGDRTRWNLVARFNSIAERDVTRESGFTQVITEGSERLNDVAKSI
jgi:uncharacterized protein YndB with AHSA1/START domain